MHEDVFTVPASQLYGAIVAEAKGLNFDPETADELARKIIDRLSRRYRPAK